MVKKVKPNIWKRVLKIAGVLLSFAGLTVVFVIQKGKTNVYGDGNTVNIVAEPVHDSVSNDTAAIHNAYWETGVFTSHDSIGRPVEFLYCCLTQERQWAYGSADSLEGGALFDEHFPRYLPGVTKLPKCNELIAVGVASEHGEDVEEFTRADRRADKILGTLRHLPEREALYKLNLGRFADDYGNDKPEQRRVIIIGILSRDPAMMTSDISYALRAKLDEGLQGACIQLLSKYRNFQLTRVG